jgi:hypothetical protein
VADSCEHGTEAYGPNIGNIRVSMLVPSEEELAPRNYSVLRDKNFFYIDCDRSRKLRLTTVGDPPR